MCKYIYISLLSFFFAVAPGYGQTELPDSGIVIKSYKIDPATLIPNEVPLDTSFEPVFRYNPIEYKSFANTFLGNSGQAAITNDFFNRNNNQTFLFSTALDMYMYNPYNIYHFNTRKPFTELKYLSSGNRDNSEQYLSFLHSQNVNQNLNIGLLYDLIASKGMYLDQNISTNRFNLFSSYTKDNYSFYTSVQFNGHKAQENGGLFDISAFVNQNSEALNYRMFLSDANSQYKNVNVFFTQKLNLSEIVKDSLYKSRFDNFAVHHTLNYDRRIKYYSDNISSSDTLNYYQNQYYSVSEVVDSAFYHNLSNRFDLSVNMINGSQEFRIYMKHEFKKFAFAPPAELSYDQGGNTIDTVIRSYKKDIYNDISIGGQLIGKLKTWSYTIDGQLFLTGYNIGDVFTEATFIKNFKRKGLVSLNARVSSLNPSYFLNHYGSSHFIWNNDFGKTESTQIALRYSNDSKISARASVSLFNDYVYLDTLALPVQLKPEIMVLGFFMDKTFIWGPFHNKHELLIQKSTHDAISLPLFSYANRSWFQADLFHDALKFQIGGELYYFTKYYGDAYMAATGNFYRQNEAEIGNYPFVKGFLNVKIKTLRFTIQYTNALAGLIDANYFMAYRYPNFNSSIKFGLAWTFND
ncbi:MAG: putative porin [Bacteroidales bacterium]|nr:putative porin [Bacteroidales bacterium]MCF8389941.1 putative porin [Bacteroidales bacterium]